jgi:hypothetical protein
MPRIRTTLTIDEDVMRAVRIKAARTGRRDSDVIEEAVRRDLGLDVLDRLWAANDMSEDAAMDLALEAQHDNRSG